MTRDEIRSLIGGYATGSLSAAERAALFEAALDDQELFDELAREQALKELLEEPGVKARLAAALAPRPRPWWAWAAAGAFAIAVIAGILLLKRPQPPEIEIARLTVPALPAPPPVVSPPAISPLKENRDMNRIFAPRAISPPAIPKEAAPLAPAPNPAPELGTGPVPAPAAAPAVPAPVQAPAQATASIAALGGVVGGVPAAVGGGRGGGGGGRGGAARPLARAARPSRFAFDYSVTPEGVLRIITASNGFLTVGAHTASAESVLFTSRSLQAGSVTEVPLPADSVSAFVIFSASEMPPAPLNTGSPMDLPSGTKSDPDPSPNSQLIAIIPIPSRR